MWKDKATKTNMPYTIEYDPQGIITIKVQGQLTMSIIRKITGEALQLAKEMDCHRALNDLREAKVELSIIDVYNLPKLLLEYASTLGVQGFQLKRAVVVSSGEKLAYFFETVSRNRVQNVKIFYDDDEPARQWLLTPQDAFGE